MTRPRLFVLIAIDAVLVIALLVGLVGHGSAPGLRPLTKLDPGSADRVTIVDDSAISVERAREGWDLLVEDGRYPARSDRIEPFLEEIESAVIIRDVTDDPDLHADFGVTEALSRRVMIDSGVQTVSLLFGSRGDEPDTVYALEAGESTVMLARAAVDFYLQQPPSFWAYLRVFPEDIAAARIVRVRLRVGEAAAPVGAEPGYNDLELVRDAGERWFLTTDPGTVEASGVGVARFARDLADLVGDGFYEGPVADLAPVVSVEFTVSDGREFSAEVLTDGEVLIVDPDGQGLPGSRYDGLRYTLAREKLLRLIPPASALAE